MSKFSLGLFLFLIFNFYLQGQKQCNLTLSGDIIDEHDGSKLAYANLQIKGPQNSFLGTNSNNEGAYVMESLCPGDYLIVVSHIGCKPDTISINLQQSMLLNLSLEHHWQELEMVEVQEEGIHLNEQRLSQKEVDKSQGESMAEMIKSIPGVHSFKTGTNVSKPMIGGFTSNRIQIVNHGVQHINQNWGDEHAPEIDPFAYVNYRVVKGASAVKYGGGAIGGIVLLEPKPLRRVPGIGGKINGVYATNNRMYAPSVLLEGNFKSLPNLSWRGQASLRKSGNIHSPNYYQDNTGIEERNFSWTIGWLENNWKAEVYYSLNNSTIGIFRGAHLGNLTDLESILASGQPKPEDTEGFSYSIGRPYQLITHEIIRAEIDRYFQNGKLGIQASRQFNIREEFDKELPRNKDLAALDLPEFSLSLESYLLNVNYEYSKGRIGYDVGGGVLLKDNAVNSFIDFIPDYTSQQFHLFGVLNYSKNQWDFEGAARVDQSELKVRKFNQNSYNTSMHEFSAITASFGIKRKLTTFSQLTMTLNYAERAPAINELYSDGLHHGTASLEYGDANLKKEKSKSIRGGYTYQKAGFQLELSAYAQWIGDFIYLQPNGIDLSTRGAFPVYEWKNTDAFFRGVDLYFQFPLYKNLQLSHKSSIILANEGKDYLVNIPANRMEHTLEYAFERAAFDFYITHLFVGKQSRFNSEIEIVEPPNAYQILSAGVGKSFSIRDKISAKAGIKVNNLLNTTYRDYLNRFRYYADEMGRDIRFTMQLKF